MWLFRRAAINAFDASYYEVPGLTNSITVNF